MDSEKFVKTIRKDFPSLTVLRDGKPPVYLDSACTALVPHKVINAIDDYYRKYAACGGTRSRHWFAQEVSNRVEGNPEEGITGARSLIKEFINAGSEHEIIFTTNTSHALNAVALGLPFQKSDVVLLTDKEHNSNLLPWLRMQNRGQIKVDFMESGKDDEFDLDLYEDKLKSNKVRLVSMAYTSNLTGYTIPAKEIIEKAHSYGVKVLLDGAQTIPHRHVDVRDIDVDFLAFSLHKMCGPRGVGVLYAKKELLGHGKHETNGTEFLLEPWMLGGGVVADATYDTYELLESPERYEMGVQDYAGQIAAGEAVRYMRDIGMSKVLDIETQLNGYITGKLMEQYGDTGWFNIIGPRKAELRDSILTFEVQRPNAIDLAQELDARANVMIRDSVFCVHAYLNKLYGKGWSLPKLPQDHRMTYRVSLYFYNTIEECDIFLDTLHAIFEERGYI